MDRISVMENALDALYTAKACLNRLDQAEKSKTAYKAILDNIRDLEITLIEEKSIKEHYIKGDIQPSDVRWIVNEYGELGIRLFDKQNFYLYKGESYICETNEREDDRQMFWRHVEKREFGEVCLPYELYVRTNSADSFAEHFAIIKEYNSRFDWRE